jgi:hypothetical protein
MATMPHWMLEGDILYGVLCGYTLYMLRRTVDQKTFSRTERASGPRERESGASMGSLPRPHPNILKS